MSDTYEALQPTGVRRLATGGLLFADTRPVTLRMLEAKGRGTRIVAKAGAGPGEFRMAPELIRFGIDSIAAWDAALKRWSLLAPDGSYVRLLRDHETGTSQEQRAVRVFDGALVFAASLKSGTAPSAAAVARIVRSSGDESRGRIVRQSDDGHLWVAPTFAAAHWTVFDADGTAIGRYQFATPLRVTWADASGVLGVTLDEDSVPHIVQGRIVSRRSVPSRTAAGLPQTKPSPSADVQQRLGRVLRGLVVPQEVAYADKGQYTTDFASLKLPSSSTESVRFIEATKRGWLAIAIDTQTGATCAMGVGLSPTAWNEAEPYCTRPSP